MPPRGKPQDLEKRAHGSSTAAPATNVAPSPAASAETGQHPSDAPASRGPEPSARNRKVRPVLIVDEGAFFDIYG